MDISADNYESDGNNRARPFVALSQTVRSLVSRLIGFFTLTDEERTQAGIYLGGEGRD